MKTPHIVCDSLKLDSIRRRYGLSDKDFHITIGFSNKDVFGVRKNKVIDLNNKFLKLLRDEFYKNENWNFIKNLSNYDLDKRGNIEAVDIDDNGVVVKMQNYYLVIKLIEDKLRIVNQWAFSDKNEKPSLSIHDVTDFFIKKFN